DEQKASAPAEYKPPWFLPAREEFRAGVFSARTHLRAALTFLPPVERCPERLLFRRSGLVSRYGARPAFLARHRAGGSDPFHGQYVRHAFLQRGSLRVSNPRTARQAFRDFVQAGEQLHQTFPLPKYAASARCERYSGSFRSRSGGQAFPFAFLRLP